MVVIMIGRKRSRQASKMESLAGLAVFPFGNQGKVDHHDGIFFTIPIRKTMPMMEITLRSL